ncbi:MAG: hypothetical protein GWO19_13635 [Nitrospinaceae bacterium]|nr:hypothetical protein [Nitrospinaceae bacterium]
MDTCVPLGLALGLHLFFSVVPAACGPSSVTELNQEAAVVEKTRLRGRVLHLSDVETIPSFPYASGTVLAIPQAKWPVLARRLDLQGRPEHLRFSLRREDYRETVAAAAPIGQNGEYEMKPDPGRYVVCLGNLTGAPPDPETVPVSVFGCVEPVDIVSGRDEKLDLFFGEGGVTR